MFLHKLKLGIVALVVVLSTGAAVVAYQGSRKAGDTAKEAEKTAETARQKASRPVAKSEFDGPITAWSIFNDVDDNPKTRAIIGKLEVPIAMKFATETPLEDVKKYIQEATQDEQAGLPIGIPIYVDPQGMQDADQSMMSTIQIDLEGLPLKTTLRLILKQIGLTYVVKDGLMIITSPESEQASPFNRLDGMANRGELSKEQYKELMEIVKLRIEYLKLMNDLNKPDPKLGGGAIKK